MRQNRAATSAAILAFTLISPGVAQEPGADQKATVARRVQITTRTDEEIRGVLTRNSMRLTFASRMETPSRAVLRLKVGNVVLDAEADLAADTRTLDGHDHGLTFDERMALVELTGELERSLDPYRRRLSPHEDFLFRLVSYWAEAPVGWPLQRRVIPLLRPLAPAMTQQASGHACLFGDESENLGDFTDDCGDEDWCGCESETGIRYLEAGCACYPYALEHDAANIHCFGVETVVAGCSLDAECLGRCGPGCGVFFVDGKGSYTYDCAEHDRCCRRHGGCLIQNLQCGDEFDDAADDFLVGAQSCPGGCDFICGDGVCGDGENDCSGSCPQDCNPKCGDGCCTGNESCSTCPGDCTDDCEPVCSSGEDCPPCDECSSGECVPVVCPPGWRCDNNHGCEETPCVPSIAFSLCGRQFLEQSGDGDGCPELGEGAGLTVTIRPVPDVTLVAGALSVSPPGAAVITDADVYYGSIAGQVCDSGDGDFDLTINSCAPITFTVRLEYHRGQSCYYQDLSFTETFCNCPECGFAVCNRSNDVADNDDCHADNYCAERRFT